MKHQTLTISSVLKIEVLVFSPRSHRDWFSGSITAKMRQILNLYALSFD